DLQVLQELLRVANLLLHFEELAHPLEVTFVAVVPDTSLLVLPVRRDPLLGPAMHLLRPDLHLEWETVLADHRGVKGLVTALSRHLDEVFDPPRHRRPRLVNDAERGITVLDRLRN